MDLFGVTKFRTPPALPPPPLPPPAPEDAADDAAPWRDPPPPACFEYAATAPPDAPSAPRPGLLLPFKIFGLSCASGRGKKVAGGARHDRLAQNMPHTSPKVLVNTDLPMGVNTLTAVTAEESTVRRSVAKQTYSSTLANIQMPARVHG